MQPARPRIQDRTSRSAFSALLVAVCLLPVTGCGSGGTDARLVGKWSGNPTLVTTMELNFRGDGQVKVKSVDADGQAKQSTGNWSVVESGSDYVVIKLRTSSSASYLRRKGKIPERRCGRLF